MSSDEDQKIMTPVEDSSEAQEAKTSEASSSAPKEAEEKLEPQQSQQQQKQQLQEPPAGGPSGVARASATTEELQRLRLVQEGGFHEALLQKMGLSAPQRPEHKFWNTQPVPKYDEKIGRRSHGPIETKTLDEVRKTPYPLLPGFEWTSCDVNDEKELEEIYQLLRRNYVEDTESTFRFDYAREFLYWVLTPPGYRQDWHLGVRASAGKKKLLAFITAIPATMNVHDRPVRMVEINFLCVHKRIRSKRLAPVLIQEITRRVNLQDIWQAAYTAGITIPKPIASTRYYHRSLNPAKLIDVNFSHLRKGMTIARTAKLYRLPDTPQLPGFRPMQEEDVESAHALLTRYLKRFKLAPNWSVEDFRHWFLPRKDVVYTYVIQNPDSKKIVALTSFFSLPSSIRGHERHKEIRAAYSFYTAIAPGKRGGKNVTLSALTKDALTMAQKEGFDVYNALNVMENESVFEELMFGMGDGNLQYYLYNWRCPEIQPSDVALVMM